MCWLAFIILTVGYFFIIRHYKLRAENAVEISVHTIRVMADEVRVMAGLERQYPESFEYVQNVERELGLDPRD